MSRGRRNQINAPASAPAPAPPAPPHRSVDLCAELDEAEETLSAIREAKVRVAAASGRGSVGFPAFSWVANEETLHAMCAGKLLEALAAGDLHDARRICAEYHRRIGQEELAEEILAMPDQVMEPAMRLRGAIPAIDDLGIDERKYVDPFPSNANGPSFLRVAHDLAGFERRMRRRFVASDATHPWSDDRGTNAWEMAHDDLASLQAAGRARLRHHDVAGNDQIELTLRATPEALAEFTRAHTGQPGFNGVRAQWDHHWTNKGAAAKNKWDMTVAAEVSATLEDGRRVRLVVETAAGEVFNIEGDTLPKRAEVFCGQRRIVGEIAPEAVRRASWVEPEEYQVPEGVPARTLDDLLGIDSCRHEGARWRDGGHGEALLSCRRCFRGAAAVVPRHRLPDGHPLAVTPDQETGYLREHAAHASLAGDPAPEGDLAALRTRDGLASLNPADYAVGPNWRRAPGRPGGSFASVFSAR